MVIFYLFAIPAIMWELLVLCDTRKFTEKFERLKKTPGSEMSNSQRHAVFFMFGYMVWGVIGLLTEHWDWFGAYILLGAIPKPFVILKKIDALISLLALILLVAMRFHLGTTLSQLLC